MAPNDGTQLDPWAGSYAARAVGLVSSEVRALFSVASRPDVVNLGGGSPYVSALPLDDIAELCARLVRERGAEALQYGTGQGTEELREQISLVMEREGIVAHPDDLVVTTGSQQALDLVSKVFLDPGDVVVAEGPSYVGALGTFTSYQADVVHVEMDDDGLIPEQLEETLRRLAVERRRPKLLYLIPNFQNPSGVTLSGPRRIQILEIARRHKLLVIEDNPYGLISFDSEPLPALRSHDEDGVIYLGSFSKTLASGLRVGWAAAPPAIREKLVSASESTVLSPSMFNQLVVSTYLANNDWDGQIKVFRELYRERRDALLQALADFVPQARWTRPAGGFFVWMTLPTGMNSKLMLPRAVSERVAYTPGTGFFADGRGSGHLRLAYSGPTPDRIREGVRRLATVIDAEQEMLTTFTGEVPIIAG
ncbi:PLP-dependent aminotransferase family protein [Saxibacter everestensis]|uniref:PLP-dependent aminotransferase family protein n=1 Tax=Saxibacter everestensis TaxID=2909229 RepID=A0ABY8QS14_9MICO|nr:PLP-dependent aminotransferase family protein [Brevibacteriaceae bacterium ZFBP1038]